MSTDALKIISESARAHAEALAADIRNASTRGEHIRLTILAAEAEGLANALEVAVSE